ncbi:MAG: DegT/DnrJ/EryC1/StrS family aminotransferase [Acidimicrobiia bacterium]|nr:DegT/DnrJ/EryC1/StrS family aminotransferase [Acidimicrobiia bacterium]
MRLPFLDLSLGEDAAAVRDAIDRVVASGWYVLGPEVDAFEHEFARACSVTHVVGVANGTDALALILRALDVGPGHEVIVPAMTAAFTALAVTMVGARPVFADVDPDRLTMDPASCEARLTAKTAAIIPVHLYGQPADLHALQRVAASRGVPIVEDCCQAHLATFDGRAVGSIGVAGAFSFYPTKNLGALGDGGAVVTTEGSLAARIRRLRNGGQANRYEHEAAGVNSRLDEIQAAVLRARLPRLPAWTARRREIAQRYRLGLRESGVTPVAAEEPGHVHHLFPIRWSDRDRLQQRLLDAGVQTLIHYPVSLPRQRAFAGLRPDDCPNADLAAATLLSLPLHPGLDDAAVDRVTGAVVAAAAERTLT